MQSTRPKPNDLRSLPDNSTMPHLHFHVMDREDPWEAHGVYCDFTNGEPGAMPIVPPLMKTFNARPLGTGAACLRGRLNSNV